MTGLVRGWTFWRKRRRGPAPKTPWNVDVYVHLDSIADPNDPQFRLETCLPVHPVVNDEPPTIIFHNRRRRGFNITFHFEDHTGGNFRFPHDADQAIWSQMGNSCPRTLPAQQVLRPERVVHNRSRLVVFNPNQAPFVGEFRYSLRVTDDIGAPILLDPGGDNQNGPVQ